MSNKNCGPDIVKYFVVEPVGGTVTGSTGDFYVCSGTTFVNTISGCTDSVNFNNNIFYNNGQTFFSNTLSACTGIYTSNLYGCSPITVHDNLILLSGLTFNTISSDNSLTQILVRDGITGEVKYRDVSSITPDTNTFVTGGTYNSTTDIITLTRNDGGTIDITGVTDTFITGGTYNQDNGVLTLLDNATNSINIDGFFTGVTISNALFVDENGDDSTGEIGRLDKPFKTLYGAKTASTSGDLIYVLPQTIIYDNRSTAGNQWNGRQNEINLWKDGITYYFSPNTKIIFYNETVSGDRLALFDTNGVSGETCTVLGYLEYEQNCNGPDTSNGHNRFLLSDLGTDGGYTFNVEVKKLLSNHCEVINIVKSNISGSEIVVNIKSEEEELQYLGGQTSSGGFYFIYGVGSDSVVKFNSYSRRRYYNYASLVNLGYPFYLRNIFSDSSKIDINGYECINLTKPLFRFRNFRNKNTNLNIDKIYYDYNSLTFSNGIITEVFDPGNLSNFILNINGDLIDYSDNSYSNQRLFEVTGPNIQINYKGDIYTKTIGGNGRSIVYCTDYPFGNGNSSNNNIKIEGDIHFLGSADTTNVLFQSYRTNSNIEFKGNIYGNYNFLAHPKLGGSVTINNSNISSTSDDFKMLDHTDTTTSTFKLNNTKVEGKNDLGTFSDGQYLNVLISNSSIVNTGSGDTLTNTTNFGRLQVVNSSIYSNSGLSINYPTTSEVITSNLTVNTDYSATTHSGEITKLTDLIY